MSTHSTIREDIAHQILFIDLVAAGSIARNN